jgi:hypothetical protein
MRDNFKSMPIFMKFITAHALSCVVFLLGSVIPHRAFSISGRPVTLQEWWSTGAGLYASLIGIILPFGALLFLQRSCYARPYYIGALTFGLIIPYLLFKQVLGFDFGYELAAVGAVTVAAVSWYLYGKKTVKYYFTSNK